MKIYLYSLSLIVLLLCGAGQPSGILRVNIVNLRNNNGSVKISLYNSPGGFPDDASKAYRIASAKISNNTAVVKFENLPYGVYAIAILHDENNNNKMDFQFKIKPKEGYGASNDAKARFGPPDFEDAKFMLSEPEKKININTSY
jgi:uncharacterized protein (DUF2141 family)